MKRNSRALLTGGVAIAIAAGAIALYFALRDDAPARTDQPAARTEPSPAAAPSTAPAGKGEIRIDMPLASPEATALFSAGLQLLKDNRPVDARAKLSEAFFSGGLTREQETQAVEELEKLAERTLFSRDVASGDEYAFYYTVRAGEFLERENGIERTLALHVPARLIEHINRLPPGKLFADRQIKLIRGPFHAVVHKGRFLMDIYLHREGLPKVLVKRMRVGLGRNGVTPVGMWRLRLSRRDGDELTAGKVEKGRWYPPESGQVRHPIEYGEPGYPFGEKGMWISLEGTEPATAGLTSYGIHSTNEPDSIGKEGSLGCIRLGDDDIEFAFRVLYEQWSTVQTKK